MYMNLALSRGFRHQTDLVQQYYCQGKQQKNRSGKQVGKKVNEREAERRRIRNSRRESGSDD